METAAWRERDSDGTDISALVGIVAFVLGPLGGVAGYLVGGEQGALVGNLVLFGLGLVACGVALLSRWHHGDAGPGPRSARLRRGQALGGWRIVEVVRQPVGVADGLLRVRRRGVRGQMRVVRAGEAARDSVDRIQREYRLIRDVDSGTINRILDGGRLGRFHFIVYEWIEGRDLASYVAEGLASKHSAEVVRIAADLATALDRLHAPSSGPGLQHRDIKPANVMVTGHGRAVLCDTSLVTTPEHTLHTASLYGTLGYVAPEVHAGGPQSLASDIYAFGATLHFLAYGMTPRESNEIARSTHAEPPVLVPGLPDAFLDLAARARAADPAARPSAKQLHAEFGKLATSKAAAPTSGPAGSVPKFRWNTFPRWWLAPAVTTLVSALTAAALVVAAPWLPELTGVAVAGAGPDVAETTTSLDRPLTLDTPTEESLATLLARGEPIRIPFLVPRLDGAFPCVVPMGGAEAASTGTETVLADCDGTAGSWILLPEPSTGRFAVRFDGGSGPLCLQPGATIDDFLLAAVLEPCSSSPFAEWMVNALDDDAIKVVHSTEAANFCLDVELSALEPGTAVQLYACGDQPNQEFVALTRFVA